MRSDEQPKVEAGVGRERAGTNVGVAWVTERKIPLRKWGSEGELG